MPVSGLPPYDDDNIFARILRGEIPAKKVYEDEWALAFHDINPQAPTHILMIPKGRWCGWSDFSAGASDAEGYRLLANSGPNSHQEVPHLHVHVFAGRPLGPMLVKKP